MAFEWPLGGVGASQVCLAVAALLPVDESYAQRFVMEVMGLENPEMSELSQKEANDGLERHVFGSKIA